MDENVDVLLKRVFPNLEFLFEGNVIIVKPTIAKDDEKEVKKYVIKGKVVDEKNQPLPGVTVRLDSTTVGCATDARGMFTLALPVASGKLIFSFVGFRMETKAFKAGDELIVKMKEETSDLDEVTVIAYGERNKKELISSISSVKSKDLEEVPSASLENLLQGHMAGVEVNNVSGAPGGGGSRIAIRGYNTLMQEGINDGTPLYVVDGVPISSFTSPITGTNTLAEIDPMTIESVEVLKDAASAAIYGSRASNGVILITTKQGKSGQATFRQTLPILGVGSRKLQCKYKAKVSGIGGCGLPRILEAGIPNILPELVGIYLQCLIPIMMHTLAVVRLSMTFFGETVR